MRFAPLLLGILLLVPAVTAVAVTDTRVSWDGRDYLVFIVVSPPAAGIDVQWDAGSESGLVHAEPRPGPKDDHDSAFVARLPGRALRYTVGNETFDLAAPPAPDGAMRFAFLADMGRTDHSWEVLSAVEKARPGIVLLGGDISYANGDARKWDDWFAHMEPVAARVPVLTALGNHETYCTRRNGDLYTCEREPREYAEHFLPPGAKPYYFVDWGPARFIALDTEAYHPSYDTNFIQTNRSEQKAFLVEALKGRPDAWNVVFFHRSLYSSNMHDDDADDPAAREDLVPLLEAGGADLVLSGHTHAYERTWPLRGGEPTTRADEAKPGDGVVYVTSGGGGRSIYNEFAAQPAWSAKRAAEFHFLVIDATPGRLDATAVRPDGSVLDAFSLARPGAPPRATPTVMLTPPAAAEATARDAPAAGVLVALVATGVALALRRLRP